MKTFRPILALLIGPFLVRTVWAARITTHYHHARLSRAGKVVDYYPRPSRDVGFSVEQLAAHGWAEVMLLEDVSDGEMTWPNPSGTWRPFALKKGAWVIVTKACIPQNGEGETVVVDGQTWLRWKARVFYTQRDCRNPYRNQHKLLVGMPILLQEKTVEKTITQVKTEETAVSLSELPDNVIDTIVIDHYQLAEVPISGTMERGEIEVEHHRGHPEIFLPLAALLRRPDRSTTVFNPVAIASSGSTSFANAQANPYIQFDPMIHNWVDVRTGDVIQSQTNQQSQIASPVVTVGNDNGVDSSGGSVQH